MNHNVFPLPALPDKWASRRKGPRIEIMGQIHGQLIAMDIPLLVRNLGAGGFGVESSVPFPEGAIYQFRFTTARGLRVVVSAESRHCRPMASADGAERFRAGFAFIHEPDGMTTQAVEALLDAATSVLLFQ